jgi:hypothetical protein
MSDSELPKTPRKVRLKWWYLVWLAFLMLIYLGVTALSLDTFIYPCFGKITQAQITFFQEFKSGSSYDNQSDFTVHMQYSNVNGEQKHCESDITGAQRGNLQVGEKVPVYLVPGFYYGIIRGLEPGLQPYKIILLLTINALAIYFVLNLMKKRRLLIHGKLEGATVVGGYFGKGGYITLAYVWQDKYKRNNIRRIFTTWAMHSVVPILVESEDSFCVFDYRYPWEVIQ